jgi:hypothetical protein
MNPTPPAPISQKFNLKSFWARPEGKTGMLALAGIAALLIYGWGNVVGFLVTMMADTVHLTLLVAAFAALLYLLFSSRTHLLFRLLMRWLTGLIITIDPIGILKDRLQQMRKRRATMGQQVSNVSGQIRFLKETIDKNKAIASQQLKQAEYAKKAATSARDQNEQLRMALQMKVKANKAGRLEQSNLSYSQLLTKLQAIYDLLTKWATHVDAYIEDTEDEVRQKEIEYKTINSAFKAYRTALSVIKGNATEEDIYNTTMEYLAEDAGRKLGEMEDFQRVAQGFMDNIDIENGVVTTDALKQLDAYEHKLLTSGNQDTAFLLPAATVAPDPVPATDGGSRNTGVAKSDYDSIFK